MSKPLVDRTRRRLWLSPAALATAVLLLPGPLSGRVREAVAPELEAFETVGLVEQGWLLRWAAELIALVVAPDLLVTVMRSEGADLSTTRIWASPEAGAIGEVDGDGTITLWPAAPTMLSWTLAGLVGLGSRPHRAPAGSRDLIAPEPGDADSFAIALLGPGRSSGWRITAQWTGPDGSAVLRSLTVVDGEGAGLWRLDPPPGADPVDEDAAVLVPATSAEVWQRLVDLLPPGTSASPDEHDAHLGRPACQQPPQPIRAPSAASPAMPAT